MYHSVYVLPDGELSCLQFRLAKSRGHIDQGS